MTLGCKRYARLCSFNVGLLLTLLEGLFPGGLREWILHFWRVYKKLEWQFGVTNFTPKKGSGVWMILLSLGDWAGISRMFGQNRLHFDNGIPISIPCWHLGLGGVTQGRTQIHELPRSSQYTSTLPEANITPEAWNQWDWKTTDASYTTSQVLLGLFFCFEVC